jgi:hypothetical protein
MNSVLNQNKNQTHIDINGNIIINGNNNSLKSNSNSVHSDKNSLNRSIKCTSTYTKPTINSNNFIDSVK